MLDTNTKRRIDTARDILVGKVPDPKSQVEQIHTHYMSQRDVDICLEYDVEPVATGSNQESISELHTVLRSRYGSG